jgi:hypothetical protein
MHRFVPMLCGVLLLFGALAIGFTQYQRARSNAEEAKAAQQAAINLRAVSEGVTQYADSPRSRSTSPDAIQAGRAEGELAEFSFIVGTWRGKKDGELVEEIWSKPHGNAMMGMFRWLNAEGRSRMYELLTISREGDETFLRLRHFSPAMVAWEEKDAPVVLKLTEVAHGRAVFVNVSETDRMERIVFHQHDVGTLAIDVEFRAESGRAPLNFQFEAAPQG